MDICARAEPIIDFYRLPKHDNDLANIQAKPQNLGGLGALAALTISSTDQRNT
jgi:hypothetical protein